MKPYLSLILIFLSLQLIAQGQKSIKDIEKFQNKLNKEFANGDTSPLTEVELKSFKSLDFFPIDTNFRVVAKLKRFENSKPFKMRTTTDRLPVYKIFASATFELKGKKFVLHIYQNQKLLLTPDFEDYLFLPYTDSTNGDTSYGGGRYIDLTMPDDDADTIVLDFNKSYNPYCAYNEKYSCPIPPPANNLTIKVEAGVKAPKY